MAPVIERISDSSLQCLRPFLELLTVSSLPGDVFFIHTIGAHQTPFIVVSAQPYLCDVLELSVLRDFLRIDVAVIVQNRRFCRVLMIQLLRCLCCE